MKILYAFQGTGNGHMARAQEIIPILKKYASVDTLISGHQSQLKADFAIDFQHRVFPFFITKQEAYPIGKRFLRINLLMRQER